MSDENTPAPGDERVDIEDPFEIPDEVEDAWDDDEVHEGEAPSG